MNGVNDYSSEHGIPLCAGCIMCYDCDERHREEVIKVGIAPSNTDIYSHLVFVITFLLYFLILCCHCVVMLSFFVESLFLCLFAKTLLTYFNIFAEAQCNV